MKFVIFCICSLFFLSCKEENSTASTQTPHHIEHEFENQPAADCSMTIESPGEYELSHDIETKTCGIEIKTSHVKINLNGYSIKGPHDMKTLSYGIKSLDKSNIEVFNGKIDGFMLGVSLVGSSGRGDDLRDIYIHDLQVDNSGYKGIKADGYSVKVTNNIVRNTGKTQISANAYCFGIEVKGPDCLVADNTVTDTYGGAISENNVIPEGVAISFSHYSTYCIAENNRIENTEMVTNKSTFGFWIDIYSAATLRSNSIRNMHYSAVVPLITTLESNDVDKPIIYRITDRD